MGGAVSRTVVLACIRKTAKDREQSSKLSPSIVPASVLTFTSLNSGPCDLQDEISTLLPKFSSQLLFARFVITATEGRLRTEILSQKLKQIGTDKKREQ